jgi:murein DD-endopeptidase MepM/ murein hydrolase activator NlpD
LVLRRLALPLVLTSLLLWSRPGTAAAQEPPEPPRPVQIHVVQPGENLFRIALQYDVTLETIQVANGLADPSLISIGQALVIPLGDNTTISPVVADVAFGESLAAAAARHGLSQEALGAANAIVNPALSYAGQHLTLPEPTHPAIDAPLQVIYPVERETLLQLAFRAGQNVVSIMLLNDLSHESVRLSGRPLAALAQDETSENAPSQLPFPWRAISLHPLPLVNGHTGGLHVETTVPGTLRATFMGGDLRVMSNGTIHETLMSLHRYAAPGLYPLGLVFEAEDGATGHYAQNVVITAGDYTSENLNLSPAVSLLLDPELLREESLYVSAIVSGYTPERYWSGLFLLPTMDDVTSGYGTIRSYNDGPPSDYHAGVDFGCPSGTPVYSPANGIVVEAGALEVRGNVVIIDHGMGVYTGYWHQSEILVEPGRVVAAGQEIGRVGSTGLSTAAHLHWEMWVNGIQVDPLQWVRESFP